MWKETFYGPGKFSRISDKVEADGPSLTMLLWHGGSRARGMFLEAAKSVPSAPIADLLGSIARILAHSSAACNREESLGFLCFALRWGLFVRRTSPSMIKYFDVERNIPRPWKALKGLPRDLKLEQKSPYSICPDRLWISLYV